MESIKDVDGSRTVRTKNPIELDLKSLIVIWLSPSLWFPATPVEEKHSSDCYRCRCAILKFQVINFTFKCLRENIEETTHE